MPSAHGIPVHVVQGRTDPFGTPAEVEAVLPPGATLDVVTGAHSIGGSAARGRRPGACSGSTAG